MRPIHVPAAVGLLAAVAAMGTGGGARAAAAAEPPAPAAGPIEWRTSLTKAFEEAKREGKPVLVAVNAERVDGGRVEPASRELREGTYKSAEVAAKAREFVAVFLKDPIDSENGGELRTRFGIDGLIVSPQHIFAHSDGTLMPGLRKEYWEFSYDPQVSVKALLALMDRALAAHRARAGTTPGTPTGPPPPPAPTDPSAGPGSPAPAGGAPAPAGGAAPQPPPDGRAEWIRATVERVRAAGDVETRAAAALELVTHDQAGDCVGPLGAWMLETKDAKKQEALQVAVLRALGKPGLEAAVPAVSAFLEHRDVEVRSNAAVTLEYVGSPKAVEALTKRLAKEKEEAVHGNLCRALGRCGAGQEAARKLLLREVVAARKETAVAGPIVAIAYFEKDAETARALEKLVKREGERLKRGAMLWSLAEIGDPKSLAFVRDELLPAESHPLAAGYLRTIAAHLSAPSADTKQSIDGGMSYILQMGGVVWDGARRARESAGWTPKGDTNGIGAGGRPMGRQGGPGGPGGPGAPGG